MCITYFADLVNDKICLSFMFKCAPKFRDVIIAPVYKKDRHIKAIRPMRGYTEGIILPVLRPLGILG